MNCVDMMISLVRDKVPGKVVLDVGSLDYQYRLRRAIEKMKPKKYFGLDMYGGQGVDIVCPIEDLMELVKPGIADVVTSMVVLEHVYSWRSAINSMKDACCRGGHIVICVPSAWPYHGCPYDFWRFTEVSMRKIFSDFTIEHISEFPKNGPSRLLYVVAKKPSIGPRIFMRSSLSEIELERISK